MEPFSGLIQVARNVRGRTGDSAVAAMASAQQGLVTTAQLRFCGLSEDAIRYRVSRGRLFRVHRGVYLAGHQARTELTPFAAAILAVGRQALLSHWSALWIWEMVETVPAVIDVVVRRGGGASRPGIRVRRGYGLHDGEVRSRHGLPVVSPCAALLDLADSGDEIGVERIDEDFSRKEGERILWRLIKASGLPRPRRNIRVEGYELDGILTVAGIQVLRFTWDQLQHPERVLVRLAAAITLAQHRRRTPATA